ncbi:response regulator transcription factor [Paraclostridium sordellii]|uniref:response regulator transcription factor n=1 Tax=Paraclostridium sordellii TaxID=1505 RepID=UPI0005DFBBC0|nr:response regulator transcription factor [Paeniclostridium sordellii]MDU2688840.1 response regulator transcription factor [Paeniclostridium sordellii]MVO71281.1 hypothetical protein [Paeniclostridium sordellii]CEO31873.1 two component transcriptional regulator [[Clostridium] sordellii] [Paeniclostridium sordellii]CEP49858.1 two component transcriptional regulator [[Clostridium] sordellii] [Paeniclostridium sordellii]
MNILILSNSLIIRESLGNLTKKLFENAKVDILYIDDYVSQKKCKNYDLTIGHTYNTGIKHLKDFIELKNNSKKIIVLDYFKNESILKVCIEQNIDGYIIDFEDEYEFRYIINKVINGSKFYDSQLVQSLMKKRKCDLSLVLTDREKEVMLEVSKGLSNREISEKLEITEFTVKKHLSKVMSKLNYRSRKEIILNYDIKS